MRLDKTQVRLDIVFVFYISDKTVDCDIDYRASVMRRNSPETMK